MQLHDLLGGVDVLEWVGDPHTEIGAVGDDSRRVGPDSLFCCVPGATTDGHDHAAAAVTRGATALLVERLLPLEVAQARVVSVRRAIGPVAARAMGDPSRGLRVIGVTGTNGKTTTTLLVGAIAEAAGTRAEVIGTFSGPRTTPEAPALQAQLRDLRDSGVELVAMEVSSHTLDQHRVDGTWFAVVGFTNLSHDHLDYHATIDDYFDAKARLFSPELTRAGVVNVGDPRGQALVARARAGGLAVRTFAVDTPADLVMEAGGADATGTRATLVTAEGRATLRLPLTGRFNLENAAAAAALALSAGLPFDAVVAGLARAPVIPGRMERVDAGQPFTVLVDYAHTPVALEQVLAAARELTEPDGRVIVVFGCGGDRDRAKRPLMGRVATERAEVVVVTSDNPRGEEPAVIADEVVAGARTGVTLELDRRTAIRFALGDARAGDVVVIAGKGHESGQTIGSTNVDLDDRLVAREELEAVSWS